LFLNIPILEVVSVYKEAKMVAIIDRQKSLEIFRNAEEVIPGGVNSPARAFRDVGILPLIAKRGKGDLIYDEDDNAYIDYCCSWGALLFGHAHTDVIAKVREQLEFGTSFGIATKIEEEIARHIVERIPCIDMIRFVSSGTEATMSAARLARGFTGRTLIVKFDGNYHGHNDTFLVKAGSGATRLDHKPSSQGIPQGFVDQTVSLSFNDVEGTRQFLREHGDKIAGVIFEPIAGNMGVVPGSRAFIEMLREETQAMGALLIFDEVITGFRVSEIGALALYHVEPDLICYGKIIGGGLPAAAFAGRQEIMDFLAPVGPVYQAGTLSGNPLACQAGLITLSMSQKEGFYEALQQKADRLLDPIRELIKERGLPVCINQVGSMFTLFFGVNQVECQSDLQQCDFEMFKCFFLYLFERGVYIPQSPFEAAFISMAHTEAHLDKTSELISAFLHTL
jgi:glutamate-1-semialdehyde 2,1-aminomutase